MTFMTYGRRGHTVVDHEEVNSEHGKALSDLVIRVLKFVLHNCSVYFNQNNATQTSQDHPMEVLAIR